MTDTSSEISLLPQVAEAALEADPVQELEQQPVLSPVVRAIQRLEDVIDTETRLLRLIHARAVACTTSTRQSKRLQTLLNQPR
jgi:hypothetical protein